MKFDEALGYVLAEEGGYVNHPKDPWRCYEPRCYEKGLGRTSRAVLSPMPICEG